MSIDNFLKNFKAFYEYVETNSNQFSQNQKELDNDFKIWLNESTEKVLYSIKNCENCAIDVFVPKLTRTEIFRDITNTDKIETTDFDKELDKIKKCVYKRDRKRKRIYSEELKKTSKTNKKTLSKIIEEKKEPLAVEESQISTQNTLSTLTKLNNKLLTMNNLHKISEEKGEDVSKEAIDFNGTRISEIHMIKPPEDQIPKEKKEKIDKDIDIILENFKIEEPNEKENYKKLINSLKKEPLESNVIIEKKIEGKAFNQNHIPFSTINKKFDLKIFNQNSNIINEKLESGKKQTGNIESDTPNFNKTKPDAFKLGLFTFSKDKPLKSNNKINFDKSNNDKKQSQSNFNYNQINKTPNINFDKDNKNLKENGKIFEILFNDKESFSITNDSPAIDKWNNLGKIFKENFKMNLNLNDNQNYSENNMNNIFTSNNLNISKSLSQKDIDKHCNNNNLPKKCFYLSETETEENRIVMMNNIQNDNFGKVPITGYEITDHSGSDSSSEENYVSENDVFMKKKKIPDWANDQNYLRELLISKKTKDNVRRIFGKLKISNLDLNVIFNTNKKSYKNRGDSADWKHDNTNSSKIYKEDIKDNQIERQNLVLNKLDLETKINEMEINSPIAIKESQIFNNLIEN